jgi:hypothetical protein
MELQYLSAFEQDSAGTDELDSTGSRLIKLSEWFSVVVRWHCSRASMEGCLLSKDFEIISMEFRSSLSEVIMLVLKWSDWRNTLKIQFMTVDAQAKIWKATSLMGCFLWMP